MDIKVVKFGGSSLADAKQFEKVAAIIKADPARRYVVPSAPGKRFSGDDKVTDLLYQCYDQASKGENIDAEFQKIVDRYNDIIRDLGLNFNLDNEFAQIKSAFLFHAGRDYAASRGEYLNGKILAEYLGFPFIDAAGVIFFNEDGSFNAKLTNTILSAKLRTVHNAVIPGFYGAMPNDTIRTFSRGGSDITGSIVARAADADLYENWTDVSGFLMADPRIVTNPKPIHIITYHELRELSYMGAGVLHEDAIFPVRFAGIPINIRNTNQPDHPGTMIRESFEESGEMDHQFLTGIAGRKNFSVISITKNGMSSEVGVLRRILEILEKYNVSVEYLPSGIDYVSLVVVTEKVAPCLYQLMGDLQKEIKPDKLHVIDNIAIVAAVGRKMAYKAGTSGKIFATLGENGISIRMITQGPEELNIIVGVDNKDYANTIRVLYDSFVKKGEKR